MSVLSLGTCIASTVLEATGKDEKASGILGWVSMGTGILGSGLETGAVKLGAKAATKPGSRLIGARSRIASLEETGISWAPGDSLTTGKDNTAVIANLWGTDLPAYRAHGHVSKKGVMNLKGKVSKPADLANDLKPYLDHVPADQPLLLISCSTGKTGFAADFADEIDRPVIGFAHEVKTSADITPLTTPLTAKRPFGEKNWLGNRLKRPVESGDQPLPPGSTVQRDLRPAIPRLFKPKNPYHIKDT